MTHSYWLRIVTCSITLSMMTTACQKDEEVSPVPATGTRTEFTLDSIFLYAQQTYLWYDVLPDYTTFDPRSYTEAGSDLANFQQELLAITEYAVNPSTGKSYEYISASSGYSKYSYILSDDSQSGSGRLASIAADEDYGFGMQLTAIAINDIRISYVAPSSPADEVGLVRGNQVTKINDAEISVATQQNIDEINEAINNSTIRLTVVNDEGETSDYDLVMASYVENPLYKSLVLEEANKTIGYICFNQFVALSETQAQLVDAFSEFNDNSITDLVVDLRYNHGGYVETADYFMGLIIPSDLDGVASYTERYNELMQSGKATILKNQPLLDTNGDPVTYKNRNATYADVDYSEKANTYTFSKQWPFLNLDNVIFITSESTASASELLINALKPYLNVTVIGEKTYGKPVGFFRIRIDAYNLYLSNFQIYNSEGEGDYFDGLEADISAWDDVTHDFGDPEEECLAAALAQITGQVSRISIPTGKSLYRFTGDPVPWMIETRTKLSLP